MEFSRRDLERYRAAGTRPALLAHIPVVATLSARALQTERHQIELGHKVIGKGNDHALGSIHDDFDRLVAFGRDVILTRASGRRLVAVLVTALLVLAAVIMHRVSMPPSRRTPTEYEVPNSSTTLPSMIKLTFCLRRRQDLTVEEFHRYWRDEHGPLVAERAEALGVRRYQQVHTLDQPALHQALRRRNGGSPEPFDGIAEVWVDDLETFRSGAGGPEAHLAARELLEDEANFIDLFNSPMWLGEEVVFVDRS